MATYLSRLFFSLFFGLAVLAGPVWAQEGEKDDKASDIVQTALETSDNFNLGFLVKALSASEVAADLKGEGPFTLFAPTDEAFNALPDDKREALRQRENKAQLQALLRYHVIEGKAMASDVTSMDSAQTLEGRSVQFQVEDGDVRLMGQNTATVVEADIEASNGVIHVIDGVLLPPEQEEGM